MTKTEILYKILKQMEKYSIYGNNIFDVLGQLYSEIDNEWKIKDVKIMNIEIIKLNELNCNNCNKKATYLINDHWDIIVLCVKCKNGKLNNENSK